MEFFWIIFGLCYVVHRVCKESFGVGPVLGLGEIIFGKTPIEAAYDDRRERDADPNVLDEKYWEPEWNKDEFVGWCGLPPYISTMTMYYKNGNNRDYEPVREFVYQHVLPEISKNLFPDGDVISTKKKDRLVWKKNYDENKYIAPKSYTYSRSLSFFEVDKKKDGTYYAWPDTVAMNMVIRKRDYEDYDTAMSDGDVDFPHFYTNMDYAEALLFYFDMPYVKYENKEQRGKGFLYDNAKLRIRRGGRPLILERCEDNNDKICSLYRRKKLERTNNRTNCVSYGYRIISKGELRLFHVLSHGTEGKEITSDVLPGRDLHTWKRKKQKFF